MGNEESKRNMPTAPPEYGSLPLLPNQLEQPQRPERPKRHQMMVEKQQVDTRTEPEPAVLKTTEADQPIAQPAKFCNIELRTWFLVHSILLTIINVPLICAGAFFIHGFIVFPFTYNIILLSAAIWNHIPCLQTIRVLAWIKLLVCQFMLAIFPAVVTYKKNINSDIYLWKQNDHIYYPSVYRLLSIATDALGYACFVVIPTIFVILQIYLVGKVLEIAQNKKKNKRNISTA